MAKNLTPMPVNSKKQRIEELAKKLEYECERDKTMINGVFHYHERPNGLLEFSFMKYKGDRIEKYSLMDGHQYTLPLAVVNHLNKNCSYPIHQHAVDANGVPIVRIGKMVRRCSFSNTDFMIEDFIPKESNLVTVEYTR